MLRSSPRYVPVAPFSSLAGVKRVKKRASRKGTRSTACDFSHSTAGTTLFFSSACFGKRSGQIASGGSSSRRVHRVLP